MGSWTFIIIQSALLAVWIVLNVTAFDPEVGSLSLHPAEPGPVVPGRLCRALHHDGQNRQQDIDRKEAENDYKINIKAELEIELLHQKIDELREKEVAAT